MRQGLQLECNAIKTLNAEVERALPLRSGAPGNLRPLLLQQVVLPQQVVPPQQAVLLQQVVRPQQVVLLQQVVRLQQAVLQRTLRTRQPLEESTARRMGPSSILLAKCCVLVTSKRLSLMFHFPKEKYATHVGLGACSV